MRRFLFGLVLFKLCAAVLYSFVGFVQPHITRQSVTMAVNQRFVLDWKNHDKAYAWLPRSLAGGDKDAILEQEFPLLNYLTVPGFFLDTGPARVVTRLIYILLVSSLFCWNYFVWRKVTLLDISCEVPSLLLVLLPISGIYFHRFMPDFFSYILCLLALGISLRDPKKVLLPLILAALGLLVKPTSIIAFGPLLLLPSPVKQIKERLIWLLPAGGLMLGYYIFVTKWIRSLSDLEPYYMTSLRNPWMSFIQFFETPGKVFALFNEQIMSPFLPTMILLFWIFQRLKTKQISLSPRAVKIWGLLVFQFLTVVLMDGAHSLIHPYYYIGLSLTAGLLWTYYFELDKNNKIWRSLLIAPLFLFNVEHSFYELRDGVSPSVESTQKFWQNCQNLKNRHPDWPWSKGLSFRSEITPVSEIGLCFGEIQGSLTSAYGFYLDGQEIPSDCHAIDREANVILVKCSN